MNIILKKIVGLLLFIFLIIAGASIICNVNYKLEGRRGASKDIAEAKRRGTYIQSYCLIKNQIDSLNIKEAFVEKAFGYGKTMDETGLFTYDDPNGNYQFTVKIEEGMQDIYYKKYQLKVKNAKYGGSYVRTSKLYCPIDTVIIKDTIDVFVLNKVNEKMDTIGELTFVKCKGK